MATNDGYNPYQVNMTGKQIEEALIKAYGLEIYESSYFPHVFIVKPDDPSIVKVGDFWYDKPSNTLFKAEKLNNDELLWFEV